MSNVKSYKRRLKSGKVISVRAHSRKGSENNKKSGEKLSYEYLKKYEESLNRLPPPLRAAKQKKLDAMWKEYHEKSTNQLMQGSRMLRSEGITKR